MGEVVDRLLTFDLLKDLTPVQAAVLAAFVDTLHLPEGTTVLREEDRSDDLYIIVSGEVRVTRRDSPEIRVLGPGDYFGEIALLTGRRRTATVVALQPVVLLRLSRGGYEAYLSKVSPSIPEELARASEQRQGHAGSEEPPDPSR